MSEAELLASLKEEYLDARLLPDGSIACLEDLFTTRAIVVGCDRWGWARRFCFSDRALASQRFAELRSEDDVPEGFTARRPKDG